MRLCWSVSTRCLEVSVPLHLSCCQRFAEEQENNIFLCIFFFFFFLYFRAAAQSAPKGSVGCWMQTQETGNGKHKVGEASEGCVLWTLHFRKRKACKMLDWTGRTRNEETPWRGSRGVLGFRICLPWSLSSFTTLSISAAASCLKQEGGRLN